MKTNLRDETALKINYMNDLYYNNNNNNNERLIIYVICYGKYNGAIKFCNKNFLWDFMVKFCMAKNSEKAIRIAV